MSLIAFFVDAVSLILVESSKLKKGEEGCAKNQLKRKEKKEGRKERKTK
jgi:hypothetical protein